MTNPNSITRERYLTRDTLMKLLSDDEVARVSTAETASRLAAGEEYIDLGDPSRGVRLFAEYATNMGNALPKQSVSPETWAKLVAHLNQAPPAGSEHSTDVGDMESLIIRSAPFQQD